MNGFFAALASLMLSSLPTTHPLVIVDSHQIEIAVANQITEIEKIDVQASCGSEEFSFKADEKRFITCRLNTAETANSFSVDVTLSEKKQTVHIEAIVIPEQEKEQMQR